ncbi:hypothetical protein HOLleu_18526 [Holothuria leucospilota]|uniref:Uncharacterized protein n=1 Tax=Holothuria leucospilota TaxID=206669 RepID=A0A9Q1H9Q4_HOLLE|nr:hypothetical protein HOLleu_18526 [Holothuria leucospilota]
MTMGEFGRENALSHDLRIFDSSANILFFLFLFMMPLVLVNLMVSGRINVYVAGNLKHTGPLSFGAEHLSPNFKHVSRKQYIFARK